MIDNRSVGSAGVSLAAQLTHSYLCTLGAAYPRGAAYFDERRVQALVVTADAVEGTVIGSAPYRVRIDLAGGALRGACTCPVGDGCKHVVALGLAYLAEPRGIPRASTTRRLQSTVEISGSSMP